MREAWIIDAVRSPRGRGKPGVGSLSNIHPQRCMAQVLNGLKEKVGFDPSDIEDVVAGCGTGSGKGQAGFASRRKCITRGGACPTCVEGSVLASKDRRSFVVQN